MTKEQKNLAQLRKDLENIYGLEADRWGHYKFISRSGNFTYRLKFQKQSVRFERKGIVQWNKIQTVPAGMVTFDIFGHWLNGSTPVK